MKQLQWQELLEIEAELRTDNLSAMENFKVDKPAERPTRQVDIEQYDWCNNAV